MQGNENKLSRKSLTLALKHYGTAVRNMEQTVLLPSLLRDVPADDSLDGQAAESSRDLYDCYHLLKAIRNAVESGLVSADDSNAKEHVALRRSLEALPNMDPEAFFHFHLRGLFSLMSSLTKKSQDLTDKYLNIVGIGN
ncbi:thyroid hormone-inducible hepatic protein [Electrophorus electricus]|uniref:thyroid hormone-inducible hepatic protein n=1 Tax=Electrophorus electricus TaxID=8005 RepID=UPI0015D06958|nr:thyroid hormone-inducible hepatic protein [Electrophorus electricus]